MKLKTIFAGALLAAASFSASADSILADEAVLGTGFSGAYVGTIVVGAKSDIIGSLFAVDSVTFGRRSFTLDQVTFTSATVGALTDLDTSAIGFSFKNVAAGSYDIFATGTIDFTPSATKHKYGLLGADFTVTTVPEPETYGMLLGGLALLGAVARRKANKAA